MKRNSPFSSVSLPPAADTKDLNIVAGWGGEVSAFAVKTIEVMAARITISDFICDLPVLSKVILRLSLSYSILASAPVQSSIFTEGMKFQIFPKINGACPATRRCKPRRKH
jgi:hypothetical protein